MQVISNHCKSFTLQESLMSSLSSPCIASLWIHDTATIHSPPGQRYWHHHYPFTYHDLQYQRWHPHIVSTNLPRQVMASLSSVKPLLHVHCTTLPLLVHPATQPDPARPGPQEQPGFWVTHSSVSARRNRRRETTQCMKDESPRTQSQAHLPIVLRQHLHKTPIQESKLGASICSINHQGTSSTMYRHST